MLLEELVVVLTVSSRGVLGVFCVVLVELLDCVCPRVVSAELSSFCVDSWLLLTLSLGVVNTWFVFASLVFEEVGWDSFSNSSTKLMGFFGGIGCRLSSLRTFGG